MTNPHRRNPFSYGQDHGTVPLVGRRAELAEMGRAIRNRGRLFLVGPRRFGKTRLLAAASAEAASAGSVVLRFDAEVHETPEALAAAILTSGVRARRGPLDRLASLLARSAPQLRPLVEADASAGGHRVTIGATSSDVDPLALLTGALDAVGQLAAEWGRNVVVVLDEVQAALAGGGLEGERRLAATIRRQPHVGYILAGSAPRLLTAMVTDPARAFFGMGGVVALGRVPEPAFLEFLDRAFREGGFEPDDGACARILERSAHVPYNVQRLAAATWEQLRSGVVERPGARPGARWPVGAARLAPGAARLTADAVDAALERLVSGDGPAYTQLWLSLTTNQKKTLLAAIESDGAGLQSAAVSRRFAISPASVQVALSALEDRQVLRRGLEDPARYRLVDPFLADWLASVRGR